LELTIESDPDKKQLPPPKEAAKKLKRRVLQSIQKWHAKFGDRHKRLTLSYNFLKNCLKVSSLRVLGAKCKVYSQVLCFDAADLLLFA